LLKRDWIVALKLRRLATNFSIFKARSVNPISERAVNKASNLDLTLSALPDSDKGAEAEGVVARSTTGDAGAEVVVEEVVEDELEVEEVDGASNSATPSPQERNW
jgi:hypothetical protein